MRHRASRHNDSTEATYRFYINPEVRDVPSVAARIVLANQRQKAVFHFKFSEAGEQELYARTDKIVAYAKASEADDVFSILQEVKQQVPQAFVNRRLPGLAYEIDEGIGFAVDPPGHLSFTQSAARLINDAKDAAGDLAHLPDVDRISRMRQAVGDLAIDRAMNPPQYRYAKINELFGPGASPAS